MGQAILFGLAASSALVIGGVAGAFWRPSKRVTGVFLAFASGALISALVLELFGHAFETGGALPAGLGLLAGAAVFVAVDVALDKKVAGPAADSRQTSAAGARQGGVGLPLLAAVTLDGVPENAALGVSLIEEASLTLLVAIFFSNLPESLVGAVAMRDEGRSRRFAIGIWCAAALVLALAVVVGRMALEGVDEKTLALLLAFAGGAVLASLADTLMPEAFEHGQPYNAFATAAGFFLSFVLAE
ncbi:MAG: zinc permease [Actinomycetota bacterium]|nr:zinc permease [Actinomycetota bacterium]